MKAVAIRPGTPNSIHSRDIPEPKLSSVPDGKGIRVKVLKVGVDATDREINEALYGNAPPGDDYLVLGHECFGKVLEVGPNVTSVKPGDYVTATVRRPGGSIYDKIGTYDMTSEETYYERGINLLHGYMTEQFVDGEEYIVKVPKGLKHLHVLMEPMSCAAKAVAQAYEAQRRMRVWRPKRAFVLGAGQIGCCRHCSSSCAAWKFTRWLVLPVQSQERDRGRHGSDLRQHAEHQLARPGRQGWQSRHHCRCHWQQQDCFEAMGVLGHSGALVWTSITGGKKTTEVPSDKINIEWVLGNKLLLGSVNANREYFESGIKDMALGEVMYPACCKRFSPIP